MINQSSDNHTPPGGSQRRKRLAGWLLALLFCAAMTGYGLLNSQPGLQWIFSGIQRLSSGAAQFTDVQGTLRDIRIGRIHFISDEFQLTLQNVRIAWNPAELLEKRLGIDRLSAATVQIRPLPAAADSAPRTPPESLHIPFALIIHTLTIDSMQLIPAESDGAGWVITNLMLSLASDGQHHQLHSLNFQTPWGAVSALAQLNGGFPFDLSARIGLSDTGSWGDTQTVITGNLEHMTIQVSAKQPAVTRDLQIQLHPFAVNPLMQLHATFAQLNPASFVSGAPDADLSVSAHLIQNDYGQLKGNIRIENHAAAALDAGGLPFSAISTPALITPEFLQLQDIRAQIAMDGLMHGNLIWHWGAQSLSATLQAEQLNPQHIDSRLQAARVSGQINLSGDAQTQSARINLKDKSVKLTASMIRNGENIALEQFNLQRNRSQLTGQGKLALSQDRSFELSGNLANFNPADFIRAPDSNLNATIQLSGQLSPHISVRLEYKIQKSRLAQSPLTGTGEIAFNGFDQLSGTAELTAGSNHLLAQGGTGEAGNNFRLTVNAPALAQLGLGLSGDLQTHMTFSGNLESPDFDLKLTSKQLHLPDNQRFSGLVADAHLQHDAIKLKVMVENYAMHEKAAIKHLAIDTHGKTSHHTLSVNAQIDEDISVRLTATGGIDRNTPWQSTRWNGQFTELSATGRLPVQLLEPAPFSVSAQSVSLGAARLSVSNGFIHIGQLHWMPGSWKTQGDFSGIALLPGMQPVSGQSNLQLGGYWNFTSGAQLTGSLRIQRERGDWHLPGGMPQPLGLEKLQLQATAQQGNLTGELELSSQLAGTVAAHGTLPLKQSAGGWSFADKAALHGNVSARISNLKWLNAILDDGIHTNGQLQIEAGITGTLSQPVFNGTISGRELSVALLEQGLNLQQGSLTARFQQADLKIDRLHFVTPHEAPPDRRLFKDLKPDDTPGSVTITGDVGLVSKNSRLDFIIDQLPVTHETDYWMVISGAGEARLEDDRLNIKGAISADAGLLRQPPEGRPALSGDIVFVNAPKQTGQSFPLHLDMNFNLGERFYLRASGLEGRLAGQLHIQNDKNNMLKVNGTIAAQDTTFKAYGQNLTVRRGIVSFQGPLDDPELNILAVREGLQVEAGVEIMGPVRHPQVKLVSTPSVPDTEKLSWIVLGRKPDAGGLDTSVLLAAAGSILGGQSGSGMIDQITQALGVDEITFRQAGIGSSLSGQIGVVGKRISSRAYLSYERGLTTTTMGITKLTYNLTPRVTIVTQAGEDSAMDLFYTLQFD